MDFESGGLNTIGLFFGLLAVLDVATRPDQPTEIKVDAAIVQAKLEPHTSCIPSAMAFGALFFLLHTFCSDSSTIITWTWTGYPIKGPVPRDGWIGVAAMAAGLVLSMQQPQPFFLPIACMGLSTLVICHNVCFHSDTLLLVLIYMIYVSVDWLHWRLRLHGISSQCFAECCA